MAKRNDPPTTGSKELASKSWEEIWAKRTSPDGFVHHADGNVTVPPLKPGEFPPSLERMRLEISQRWRKLGYSPSPHWVQRWILNDLHHAQDFLDGKITYARNPFEHVPSDDSSELPAMRLADLYNVFVPTFAPQYQALVDRGGIPGASLKDKNRSGVWVPQAWVNRPVPQQPSLSPAHPAPTMSEPLTNPPNTQT